MYSSIRNSNQAVRMLTMELANLVPPKPAGKTVEEEYGSKFYII